MPTCSLFVFTLELEITFPSHARNTRKHSNTKARNLLVYPVDKPELPPFKMPHRFRTDVAYFMTPAGEEGVPGLAAGEYCVRLKDARRWLDELVVEVVSPLAAMSTAEIELTEEQEQWLEWMIEHEVERIRLEAE